MNESKAAASYVWRAKPDLPSHRTALIEGLIKKENAMTPGESQATSGPASERGHNYVTGTATIRPGTFTESGQSAVTSQSGGFMDQAEGLASTIGGTVEEAWDSAIRCMSRHPVAVFLTGIGLGMLLALAFLPANSSRRF
jgi:hypothetical protein